jgi:uncharacterized cupin superfamily protein
MPVIEDTHRVPGRRTTIYPAPYDDGFDRRYKRALTELLRLTQFGVNLTTLDAGGCSSLRHWHAVEDEFVFVLTGTITLVTDAGRTVLMAGAAASFPAGEANAHQLVNEGVEPATYLEVGTRAQSEDVVYADVDLVAQKREGKFQFFRKSGEPYP